ncbi:AIM24 domain-containing protein [Senna tora]|uniref:AIM24 domain-containing protein n=1 Tax=Senna tora TaxID=362788 RepID=A0A834WR15_9FABA|nr:AIM24 domain-containing protein [Senna tora]
MVRQILRDQFGQECEEPKYSNPKERFEPCGEFSLDFGSDGDLEDESQLEVVMSKVETRESLLDEVQTDEVIEDHSHIETNSDAMLSNSNAILFEAYDGHSNAEVFRFKDMVSASDELLNFVGATFGINSLIAYEKFRDSILQNIYGDSELAGTDASLEAVGPQVNRLCMEAKQVTKELVFICFMYGSIENEVGMWQWLFGKTITIIILPNLKLSDGICRTIASMFLFVPSSQSFGLLTLSGFSATPNEQFPTDQLQEFPHP